jgi:acyl-CoA reductase-like NAD-dependent aldehyde dehydrogenase
MSTNRIIVDAKVYDGFVDRFTTHVKGLKVGNPNEPDTAIGPVINQNQLSSVDDTVTGPFGGEKNSGIGRFGDEWIIHEFTLEHWVTVRHSRTTYPF